MTDLKEQIAIALWHRFAPEWHVDWSEEEYQAEYRDAADAVLLLAQPPAAQVSPALTANGVCLNCGTDESFGCDCNEVAGVRPPAAQVEMETCSICGGSGYSNHPDSGEICAACNGGGGVETAAPACLQGVRL